MVLTLTAADVSGVRAGDAGFPTVPVSLATQLDLGRPLGISALGSDGVGPVDSPNGAENRADGSRTAVGGVIILVAVLVVVGLLGVAVLIAQRRRHR